MAHGTHIDFDWQGRTARAWLPESLATRTIELDETTVRATERAVAALRASDIALPTNWEPLARLLLRTEGIASSSIEGVHAQLDKIVLAEITSVGGSEGWIADNLRAVDQALNTPKLNVSALHDWHRSLMTHNNLPAEMIGSFRKVPSWIGGTSPLDAAFVPPPANQIRPLITDLIAFARRTDLDPVTQAAIVHAQFETIHPYGDGNGRLGRALIGWTLRNRGVVERLPPPISVLIARDAGGYLSGLHVFREGSLSTWVRWFADIVERSATQTDHMVAQVTTILTGYETALTDLRADAAARRIIARLPEQPVLNATTIADALGVSTRAARDAIAELVDRDILTRLSIPIEPAAPGRPSRWYAAHAILDATRNWAA